MNLIQFADHYPHAFFHGGHELHWNRAALDLVTELQPGAALHRFDAQFHFSELARAAALLLVAIARGGHAGDGFAVGDGGLRGVEL